MDPKAISDVTEILLEAGAWGSRRDTKDVEAMRQPAVKGVAERQTPSRELLGRGARDDCAAQSVNHHRHRRA